LQTLIDTAACFAVSTDNENGQLFHNIDSPVVVAG
jgi:hypothetical protein